MSVLTHVTSCDVRQPYDTPLIKNKFTVNTENDGGGFYKHLLRLKPALKITSVYKQILE